MFGAGDHAPFFHSLCQSRPQRADQESILPICLLASAPARMVRDIDTDSAEKVCPGGYGFLRNRFSNLLFQLPVECSRPHDRCREASRLADSADDASGTVAELHLRNTQPRAAACLVRMFIVMSAQSPLQSAMDLAAGSLSAHQVNLLCKSHLADQVLRLQRVDIFTF